LASACYDLEVVSLTRLGSEAGGGNFYELRMTSPGWKNWRPGQFLMVRPERFGQDKLWGRPFTIARCDDEHLVVYFQVIGRGTGEMAQIRPGDKVAVWGPLGNSFAMEPDTKTLILAGGVGVASFVGYVETHPKPDNLRMVFGHTKPYDCYPCSGIESRIRHEAFFEQGREDLMRFIALLEERMADYGESDLVLACGPMPFMKTIKEIGAKNGARVQISLDNRMACGVGACLGCVAKSHTNGYVTACTRGPVVWANDIDMEEA